MVGNCPIHGISKLQTKIAVSTMEAEYVALSTAMHALIPLWTLVDNAKHLFDPSAQTFPCTTYSTIFKDNNGVLILATSPRMTPQSKHIAVRYHFFKDFIHQSNGAVRIAKVTTGDQVVDCVMKERDKVLFHHT